MSSDFPRPILTVDIVPLALRDDRLSVLRARYPNEPFAGRPALIGGYVHADEDAHLGATARRVLADRAGLTDLYVEQLSTFSGAARDPRGWSASVAYFSLSPLSALKPALAREGLDLVPVDVAAGMPLDHDLILAAALERLRGKGAYSDLPARLLPDEFTLAELSHAYEIVLGEPFNVEGFRRKVMGRDFLEDTGRKRREPGTKRPSTLFRLTEGFTVFDRRV